MGILRVNARERICKLLEDVEMINPICWTLENFSSTELITFKQEIINSVKAVMSQQWFIAAFLRCITLGQNVQKWRGEKWNIWFTGL